MRSQAPMQGYEAAPDAWLEIEPFAAEGLDGIASGTRSPDRPNPLGLHRVTVRKIAGNRLRIGPIEAIDGTPVVDIKPVLARSRDS